MNNEEEKYFANEALVKRINANLSKVEEAYQQIVKHNYGFAKDLLRDLLFQKYCINVIEESDIIEKDGNR